MIKKTEYGVRGCWSSFTLKTACNYFQGCHKLLGRLFTAQVGQTEGQYGLKYSLNIVNNPHALTLAAIARGMGHMVS